LRYLVLSDIHGNLVALERLLQETKNTYDAIINLGDVVNYGPWSNECVDLIAVQPNCISLLGNHETYFLDGAYKNPGKISEQFFDFCYPFFTRFEKIELYKEKIEIANLVFTHTLDGKYIFKDTLVNVASQVCLGHSHQQFCNELNKYKIYNPGSVGQNRAFINVIEYAYFNTKDASFELRKMVYDIKPVIQEMENRNYPKECIDYYKNKKQHV
jgi:predicted phosphodiesterase